MILSDYHKRQCGTGKLLDALCSCTAQQVVSCESDAIAFHNTQSDRRKQRDVRGVASTNFLDALYRFSSQREGSLSSAAGDLSVHSLDQLYRK